MPTVSDAFPGRMDRTRPLAVVFGVTAVALVAACGGGGGGGAQASETSGSVTTAITVGVPPAITADAVSIAQAQGYFAANHLKVETKTLNGGAAAVPALQGGAIQIAQSNVFSVIQGAGQGLTVPCFAGASGIPKEGTPLPLISSPKAGVAKGGDLVGKAVAVNATGGVNQLLVQAWLAQQGVDYSGVHFVALGFPAMPQAIDSGQVAAAVPVDPFASQMLAKGDTLLAADLMAAVDGRPVYACWNATSEWLKKNPTVATGFLAAIKQANDYITSQPDRFRDYVTKSSGIPAEVVQKISIPLFTTDMSAVDVQEWVAAGKKYGVLTGAQANVDTGLVFQSVGG